MPEVNFAVNPECLVNKKSFSANLRIGYKSRNDRFFGRLSFLICLAARTFGEKKGSFLSSYFWK